MPIVRPEPGPLSELCAELAPILGEARAKDPAYTVRDAMLTVPGAHIVTEWLRRHGLEPGTPVPRLPCE